MLLELTTAAFFFLIGVILVALGRDYAPPLNSPFYILAGVIWLVLGLWTLTGGIIQGQPYTFANLTYSNLSYGGSVIPVVSGINQTTAYIPLNSSSSAFNLVTAGVFGIGLTILGIVVLILGIMEINNYNKERERRREEES